jgi:hypothetical protein
MLFDDVERRLAAAAGECAMLIDRRMVEGAIRGCKPYLGGPMLPGRFPADLNMQRFPALRHAAPLSHSPQPWAHHLRPRFPRNRAANTGRLAGSNVVRHARRSGSIIISCYARNAHRQPWQPEYPFGLLDGRSARVGGNVLGCGRLSLRQSRRQPVWRDLPFSAITQRHAPLLETHGWTSFRFTFSRPHRS